MSKVSHLIRLKGGNVYAIEGDKTVLEALRAMTDRNAGAIVVTSGGRFVGLMTERDYARKVILKGKHSDELPVSDIIEAETPTVKLTDSIEHCMELMADRRIRYLPVMEADQLVGIVSMGDLVRYIMDDQRDTINQLRNFISGS